MLQLSWRLVYFGHFIQPLFWESVILKNATGRLHFGVIICDLYTHIYIYIFFVFLTTSNKLQVFNVAKLASKHFRIRHIVSIFQLLCSLVFFTTPQVETAKLPPTERSGGWTSFGSVSTYCHPSRSEISRRPGREP